LISTVTGGYRMGENKNAYAQKNNIEYGNFQFNELLPKIMNIPLNYFYCISKNLFL
jgi:hypothetical protein